METSGDTRRNWEPSTPSDNHRKPVSHTYNTIKCNYSSHNNLWGASQNHRKLSWYKWNRLRVNQGIWESENVSEFIFDSPKSPRGWISLSEPLLWETKKEHEATHCSQIGPSLVTFNPLTDHCDHLQNKHVSTWVVYSQYASSGCRNFWWKLVNQNNSSWYCTDYLIWSLKLYKLK